MNHSKPAVDPGASKTKVSLPYIKKTPYYLNPETPTSATSSSTRFRTFVQQDVSSFSTPKKLNQPFVNRFSLHHTSNAPNMPMHMPNMPNGEMDKKQTDFNNNSISYGISTLILTSSKPVDRLQTKTATRPLSQRKPEHHSQRTKESSSAIRNMKDIKSSGRFKKLVSGKNDLCGVSYNNIDSSAAQLQRVPGRLPRRRAVVIGINYVFAPDIMLRGCCNDATVMALTLINLCEFKPEEVILLIDTYPSECYRSPHFENGEGEEADDAVLWKDRQPTRRNILLALNWLRADTLPGDVLFFFFAGHGIQVDDMSGWEGEGYDEAILPMDFFGEEVNAITAVMIRNLILSVCSDVQLTMVIDCTGGQTMLDPSGTGGWSFIKGVRQKGVWPFITDATDKVLRATYDSSTWVDESMKRRGVRPRFVPGVDVSSIQELLDHTLQVPAAQMSSRVKGFLFAAAPWCQVAIEAKMPSIALHPITKWGDVLYTTPVTMQQGSRYAYHGVFSWAFITSLSGLLVESVTASRTKSVSYERLLQAIDQKIKSCKSKQGGLIKLSQSPELTFFRAGGGNANDILFWPCRGTRYNKSLSSDPGLELPCIPHETRYLSPWEAEEQLHQAAKLKREKDPTLRQLRKNDERHLDLSPHLFSTPQEVPSNPVQEKRFQGFVDLLTRNEVEPNELLHSSVVREPSKPSNESLKNISPLFPAQIRPRSPGVLMSSSSPHFNRHSLSSVGMTVTKSNHNVLSNDNRSLLCAARNFSRPITPTNTKDKSQSKMQRARSVERIAPTTSKGLVPSPPGLCVSRNATAPSRNVPQRRGSDVDTAARRCTLLDPFQHTLTKHIESQPLPFHARIGTPTGDKTRMLGSVCPMTNQHSIIQRPCSNDLVGVTPLKAKIGDHIQTLTPRRSSGFPTPQGQVYSTQKTQYFKPVIHPFPSGMTTVGYRITPHGVGTSEGPYPKIDRLITANSRSSIPEPTSASREAFERYANGISPFHTTKASDSLESSETDVTTAGPNTATQSSETFSNSESPIQRSCSLNGIVSIKPTKELARGMTDLSLLSQTPNLQYQGSMTLVNPVDHAEAPRDNSPTFQTTSGHARSYESRLSTSLTSRVSAEQSSLISKSPRFVLSNSPSFLSHARSVIKPNSTQLTIPSKSYNNNAIIQDQMRIMPYCSPFHCPLEGCQRLTPIQSELIPTTLTRKPFIEISKSFSLPRVSLSRSASGTCHAASAVHHQQIQEPQ